MEEQALYRAILAGPHDDAARLVYADWLDENADQFPHPVAKAERARAELIRLQCELTRLLPDGWRVGPRTFASSVAKRERRLLFQHGKKWRRAFPVGLATAPFDRGFLRPFRALRPQEFLGQLPNPRPPTYLLMRSLPADSPVRRYVPENERFVECPLWDVHLFASGWQGDPLADHGQYADLLAEVGRSPALARVGWLKVSFFQTPTVEFLRRGHFPNVETLVLNSGPFPEVLEAVAENESFRSLRYVQFGADWWAWANGFPAMIHYLGIDGKLRLANARHLPFGEMRAVLRGILRDTPVVAPAPLVPPLHRPLQFPTRAHAPTSAAEDFGGVRTVLSLLWLACVIGGAILKSQNDPTPPKPAHQFDANKYQIPAYEQYKFDPEMFKPKRDLELEALMKRIREGKPAFPPEGKDLSPDVERWLREAQSKPPVAPPPRPVERKPDPSDEK